MPEKTDTTRLYGVSSKTQAYAYGGNVQTYLSWSFAQNESYQPALQSIDRYLPTAYDSEVNRKQQLQDIPSEWLLEFEAASRRPLAQRWKYAFIRTYKPVLDDAEYRSFDTMEDYRRWCDTHLPRWLGYARI